MHPRYVTNGYNFTSGVRKVLQMAREEAARLHHDNVGTEHILLGLIREGEDVAAAVLSNLNVDLEEIRQKVEETVVKGTAEGVVGPDLPYTSRAKKVLELAMSEAQQLKHSYVGTEHLLLGLLREEKGVAAHVLAGAGVNIDQTRGETLRLVGGQMDRRAEILTRMRDLVSQLLGGPALDAGRLGTIAAELNRLLDELGRMT